MRPAYLHNGGHVWVFSYGPWVVKVGSIPQHLVDFLQLLPKYRPEIVLYATGRYIPWLGRVGDVLVMRRYDPLVPRGCSPLQEAMAHRLAGYMRGELSHICPYVWGDSTGFNLAYDGSEFVIIDG